MSGYFSMRDDQAPAKSPAVKEEDDDHDESEDDAEGEDNDESLPPPSPQPRGLPPLRPYPEHLAPPKPHVWALRERRPRVRYGQTLFQENVPSPLSRVTSIDEVEETQSEPAHFL